VNGRAPRSVRFGLAQHFVGNGGGIPLPEEQEAEQVHDRVALRPTEVAVRRLAGGISQMKQAAQANNTTAARIPSSAGRWSIRLLLMPLPFSDSLLDSGYGLSAEAVPTPAQRNTLHAYWRKLLGRLGARPNSSLRVHLSVAPGVVRHYLGEAVRLGHSGQAVANLRLRQSGIFL
jgi:hypothetical protein